MRSRTRLCLLGASAVVAACGGGGDDAAPRPVAGSLEFRVVPEALHFWDPSYNGTYSSENVTLSPVDLLPIGQGVEVCRFTFAGLQQDFGRTKTMSGEIRYIPGANSLNSASITIDALSVLLSGTSGATVDRAGERIVFVNATFATLGTDPSWFKNNVLGTVPLPANRPAGC